MLWKCSADEPARYLPPAAFGRSADVWLREIQRAFSWLPHNAVFSWIPIADGVMVVNSE